MGGLVLDESRHLAHEGKHVYNIPFIPSPSSPFPEVDRFDFKVISAAGSGDGVINIITDPSDESDPCGSSSTTLSGVINIPQTGGWSDFQEMDIDTSSV